MVETAQDADYGDSLTRKGAIDHLACAAALFATAHGMLRHVATRFDSELDPSLSACAHSLVEMLKSPVELTNDYMNNILGGSESPHPLTAFISASEAMAAQAGHVWADMQRWADEESADAPTET